MLKFCAGGLLESGVRRARSQGGHLTGLLLLILYFLTRLSTPQPPRGSVFPWILSSLFVLLFFFFSSWVYLLHSFHSLPC